MRREIEEILRTYADFRATKPFKGPHRISQLFLELGNQISELAFIKENENLIVKSSYGKGNWAAVPWLAVMDTRETSSTQDGTYIVFLFRENGEGCSVKIGQGVTKLRKSIGAKGAIRELERKSALIRKKYNSSEFSHFDQTIDSGVSASTQLAQLYEQSTIFSKYYPLEELPDDDQLTEVLRQLLQIYAMYIADRKEFLEDNDLVNDDLEERIWAVGAGENGSEWSTFLEKGRIAIGWQRLGDLSRYSSQHDILEALRTEENKNPTNDALACYQFSREISVGDIVVAKIGRKKILGMGRVVSGYEWDGSEEGYPNTLGVKWLRSDPTEFPGSGTTTKTLTEITPYTSFVSLVKGYLDLNTENLDEHSETQINEYSVDSIIADGCFLALSEIRTYLDRLRVKKNIILQGPPGTGKTWLAKRLAYALIGEKSYAKVKTVQFHSNISYEDFVRGYRPSSNGTLALIDGPFMEAVEDASNTSQPFVVVIEEINRGQPAQIFGEMLTLLEADKRNAEEAMQLTYKREGSERVFIPPNLYVIGTMNIADRSLALVDLALRRRFAFLDLEPKLNNAWREFLRDRWGFSADFISRIEAKITDLNEEISNDSRLGPQFCIGHSYVTPPDEVEIRDADSWFRQVAETEIAPLLMEYWFDDYEKAKKLAEQLVHGL